MSQRGRAAAEDRTADLPYLEVPEAQVTPVFERYLYRPVIRAVEWLADAIRPLQSGDINLYLLYVVLVILLGAV